ncbi:MAG: hypothetical protein HYZ75_11240 [Elusimicrobia bacterium]|nr:hypothetical protein [Elusimicrobiota bacterium]
MNARLVAFFDSALEACLLVLAFVLPLAVELKAYDPYSLKAALLAAGSALAAGLWLARALEAGRVEVPAPRAGLAGLGALLLVWTVLRGGAGEAGAVRAAGPALFLIALLGPGSAGFARSLCWAALSAAALAGGYAVTARLGLDPLPWQPTAGTLGSPGLLAAALLAAVPLAAPLLLDPEAPGYRRALAGFLGAVCVAGLAAAAAALDAAALAAAMPAKAEAVRAAAAMLLQSPWSGIGAGELPIRLLWGRPEAAAALLPVPPSEPLATAAELGLPAAALWGVLILGSVSLALLDARRRLAAGDKRNASLAGAQGASLILLVGAGLLTGASYAPAPGVWLWLLAGSAAALALEEGASVVRALPLPLPPAPRRLLMLPLAAAVAVLTAGPLLRAADQLRLNRGAAEEEAGEGGRALELYRSIAPDSLSGLQARLRGTRILLEGEGTAAAEEARAFIAQAAAVDARFGDVLYLRAEADRRRKAWAEAAKGFELYAALNPADARTYKPLAELRQTLGDRQAAVDAAQALVRLSPESPEAWRFYAEQVHTIDPDAARPLYKKAAQVQDLATTRRDTQLIP